MTRAPNSMLNQDLNKSYLVANFEKTTRWRFLQNYEEQR